MRRFLVFALLALGTQAQMGFAQSFGLTDALAETPGRSAVVTARTELQDAAVSQRRVVQDPLAVRSDKLQAEQRLDLARVSFVQTFYAALQEITSAYTGVLQAKTGVAVAQQGVALAEKALEIAQIRFDGGSAVRTEVDEAQVSLDEARNARRSAQDGLNVALSNLEGLLGRELRAAALADVPDDYLVPIPELESVLGASQRHPTLVQAVQGLAGAELAAAVLAPSYASPTQLESAQSALSNARAGADEARRGFRIQVRTLYNSAQNAKESYRVAQETLQNTNERLKTERQRYTGGLISRLTLDQAELQSAQAEQNTQGARYAFLDALLGLQSGTLVDLAGPAVLNAPSLDTPLFDIQSLDAPLPKVLAPSGRPATATEPTPPQEER